MEIGTSMSRSSRFCAETTISSSWPAGGLSAATHGLAASAPSIAKVEPSVIQAFFDVDMRESPSGSALTGQGNKKDYARFLLARKVRHDCLDHDPRLREPGFRCQPVLRSDRRRSALRSGGKHSPGDA